MDIKYELTENFVDTVNGRLYQIRATKNIPARGVKKGDLGGYLQTAYLENGDARVAGNAWVSDNAQVYGNGRVFDDALVAGNAKVYGNGRVFDEAHVSGNADIFGGGSVYGYARVFGDAAIYGNGRVFGEVEVYGNAQVYDNALVSGGQVYGDAQVDGNAWINGNAQVYEHSHHIVVGPIGPRNVYATIFRTENGQHIINSVHLMGTIETLMAQVKHRLPEWSDDKSIQKVWVAQYRALKALGKVTVARWA